MSSAQIISHLHDISVDADADWSVGSEPGGHLLLIITDSDGAVDVYSWVSLDVTSLIDTIIWVILLCVETYAQKV